MHYKKLNDYSAKFLLKINMLNYFSFIISSCISFVRKKRINMYIKLYCSQSEHIQE